MAQPVYGEGSEGILVEENVSADPVEFIFEMRQQDSCGIQLITELAGRYIQVTDTDHVAHTSKTWTFANGGFGAGDIGASIVITGTATSDGTYVISSVTNARVIVTATGPGSDETFTADAVLFLEDDVDPLAGDWAIEVSNNYCAPNSGSYLGQSPNVNTDPARWSTITTQFSPTINAVVTASSQYAQADLTARAIRVTFTPSDGEGTVRIQYFAKSWS